MIACYGAEKGLAAGKEVIIWRIPNFSSHLAVLARSDTAVCVPGMHLHYAMSLSAAWYEGRIRHA